MQYYKYFIAWLFSCAIFFSQISCSDTGVLATIEGIKEISDGELSNNLFAHSIIELNSVVYLGSKFVWKKTSSGSEWQKISLPDYLDPNENPVVSIATDGSNLFLASNKKLYTRNKSGFWERTTKTLSSKESFPFYALRGVDGKVLAVDDNNTIYRHTTAGEWEVFLRDTAMNDFTKFQNHYYLASGKNLIKGRNLNELKSNKQSKKQKHEITNLLSVSYSSTEYFYMLANSKLYHSQDGTSWELKDGSESSGDYISLVEIEGKLIVGRVGAGYHIYNIASDKWQTTTFSDGFTDTDSIRKLSSGISIMDLSLGIFLYFDALDNNNDRLYSTTVGNFGVFAAKRNASKWAWAPE